MKYEEIRSFISSNEPNRSVVVSMGESRYVTAENIETDTWREINTHFYAFLYKQSSIADLHTLQPLQTVPEYLKETIRPNIVLAISLYFPK
jgi:hypothetical protein